MFNKKSLFSVILKAKTDARERNDATSKGATALSTSSFDDINETITWSWNPQAAPNRRGENKSKQDSSCSPGDYLHQLSYNCYDQTLDKLMGEFNVSKHKRNWNRNDTHFDATVNGEKSSIDATNISNPNDNYDSMCAKENSEGSQNACSSANVKDVNFWTKVFFNNNNITNEHRKSQNDARQSSSESSGSSSSNNHHTERKSKNQPTNTAILLNSFISNLKPNASNTTSSNISNITSNIDTLNRNLNLNDLNEDAKNPSTSTSSKKIQASSSAPTCVESLIMTKPSYTLLNKNNNNNSNGTAKNATPKRKNITNLSAHRQGESDHSIFNDANETNSIDTNGAGELSDGNDLNSSNSIFLQTLNDLQLEHHSFASTGNSRETNENGQSTSKDRFVYFYL